jgi:prenylcysteine oxidase/farnesylcysteine lyase
LTMLPRHPPLLLALAVVLWCQSNAYKVAIIGGGISGTFAAKYLAEYDVSGGGPDGGRDCLLDEIVIYDVSPPPFRFDHDNHTETSNKFTKPESSSDPRPQNWQGSRVASITLLDGSVVELGASIIYEGNQLVVDMMNGDPNRLKRGTPNGIGSNEKTTTTKTHAPSGFGIYHGDQQWLLNTGSSFYNYPSFLQPILKRLYLLWRYNLDIFRLSRAVKQALQSFDEIYLLLNDTKHDVTYFDSPIDIWQTMGLRSLASISFHDFLDGLGMYRDATLELDGAADGGSKGWGWRRWVPGMGCMRAELLSAMTLNTYNQDLNQMNGFVGLAAYISAVGTVFSIEGGNHQLMDSALYQAAALYDKSSCSPTPSQVRIQRHQKIITTVVASENSMELFEGTESLGNYDIVILAAPLQQCRIQFLVRSPMGLDDAVLHEMPLGGLKENLDLEDVSSSSEVVSNEHGEHLFAAPLPASATIPYTSVVTTLVSNASLNATHFGLRDVVLLPQSVFVSERGKRIEGITTLTILSIEKGLVKTFSSKVLDLDYRNIIFGSGHVVEYVQVWGGDSRYGGATPSFGGGLNTESLPFLLYDGAEHYGKGNPLHGPALFYSNAIESAVAAMEISAIGAKSTAKLVARRLGLIRARDGGTDHDEL